VLIDGEPARRHQSGTEGKLQYSRYDAIVKLESMRLFGLLTQQPVYSIPIPAGLRRLRTYLEIVEEFGNVILKAALPVLRPEESLFAPSFPERFFTPGEDLGVQQLS